jgi:hypothetical protein
MDFCGGCTTAYGVATFLRGCPPGAEDYYSEGAQLEGPTTAIELG